MLVLSREKFQSIMITDDIKVIVLQIKKDSVRLGIEAPKHVAVHRQEVWDAIQREKKQEKESLEG